MEDINQRLASVEQSQKNETQGENKFNTVVKWKERAQLFEGAVVKIKQWIQDQQSGVILPLHNDVVSLFQSDDKCECSYRREEWASGISRVCHFAPSQFATSSHRIARGVSTGSMMDWSESLIVSSS